MRSKLIVFATTVGVTVAATAHAAFAGGFSRR
jgi:hypothetical protein